MAKRWIIGLASGSSADGAEAALVEVEGVGLAAQARLLEGAVTPYPEELSLLIRDSATGNPCKLDQLSLLHRLLGETFASTARTVADKAHTSLNRVQCVGCPGHTLWHQTEGRFPHTLSLGMPAIVAERLGLTTVSNFRSRDVAVGGEGVPLAALTDHLLFRHATESRLLLHLGGLARLVYLPPATASSALIGFEAGPCNILLNAMMRRFSSGRNTFDSGGRHAVQGKCIEGLLQSWLADPYLKRRPPKSLPRHLFADTFALEAEKQIHEGESCLHDLLCTATHFVARCITDAIHRFLPPLSRIDRILVSGGGARNGLLWHLIEQHLEGKVLSRSEEANVSGQYRKALSFGLLAALTLDGVPGNVPSATGASAARLLGSITPGSPSNWAHCLTWMADHVRVPVEHDA